MHRKLFCVLISVFLLAVAAPAAPKPAAWFVDSLTKVFADDQPGSNALVQPVYDAARRSTVSIQLAVRGAAPIEKLSVEAVPLKGSGAPISSVKVRWVEYVGVNSNTPDTPDEELVRKAPGQFPDALESDFPLVLDKDKTRSIWVTVKVPENQKPGEYKGELRLQDAGKLVVRMPYRLRVHSTVLPQHIPLAITNYFNLSDSHLKRFYGVERHSPEWWDLMSNLAHFLAEYHQDCMYADVPSLAMGRIENGVMRYDFTNFERFFGTFFSAGVDGNFQGGNLLSRQRRKGATLMVRAWVEENGQAVLKSLPYEDPKAKQFLETFLPALYAELQKKSWVKNYLQGVMDEPTASETKPFTEVADMVRKHMPGIRIIEPMSLRLDLEFLKRNIDIWVMHLKTIEGKQEVVEQQAKEGRTLWYYTALNPRGKYPNRFIDYSLLKVRLIHWMNFKYGLSGYLHWGGNYWGADPYKNTQPVINEGRTLLPPGDAYITYPDRVRRTFKSSLRLEHMREGVEDFALLDMLNRKDPEKAKKIAGDAVTSFTDYVRDPKRFREIRKALLEAL
jgi:hypothetical protein